MNKLRFADPEAPKVLLRDMDFGQLVVLPDSDAVYMLSDIFEDNDCLLVDIETGEHIYKNIMIVPKVIYNAEIILTREAV